MSFGTSELGMTNCITPGSGSGLAMIAVNLIKMSSSNLNSLSGTGKFGSSVSSPDSK